jgi:hypothetical protein
VTENDMTREAAALAKSVLAQRAIAARRQAKEADQQQAHYDALTKSADRLRKFLAGAPLLRVNVAYHTGVPAAEDEAVTIRPSDVPGFEAAVRELLARFQKPIEAVLIRKTNELLGAVAPPAPPEAP